ncbi:hypothetical protein BUALT_Bualt12G0079200 [Buddleja alternifolia]|uniref:FAR1 domain-containing protein n=1 Tax=Buddleja alternifolia TaxID=168488 RepID=A0AAV6WZY7_9LAMI|nr:hypothetical protein BUALT_Bualt12G0079200 [Buddleja alternifolia]
MDKDICVDYTIRRKLDFHSDEAEKETNELEAEKKTNELQVEKETNELNELEAEKETNESGELVPEFHLTISEEKIPKIGVEFVSEKVAYNFYNAYAKLARFGIRRHHVHRDVKGNIIDTIFCCACQGHKEKDKRDVEVKSIRPETRTGCDAMMKINCRQTGKYKVINFIAHHNGHDLVSPTKTHLLRSHRSVTVAQASQADDIEMSGTTPKAGFQLMARQAGGR